MARIRTIKPSFFMNEKIAELPPKAQLLFIGLWILADREGRLQDRPRRIRGELFPYEVGLDLDELLNELEKSGFILRYGVKGSDYLQVVNFTKHQMPHYKEVASVIPPPPNHKSSGITPGGVDRLMREAVIARDKQCVECGATGKLAVDHIIPRSKGGGHGMDNLQTLCGKCNSSKGNRNSISNRRRLNVKSTSPQDQSNVPGLAAQEGNGEQEHEQEQEQEAEADSCRVEATSTDVRDVFEYWVMVMGKTDKALLTPGRRQKIKARLREGYSVDQLKRAIDGCRASEFHQGMNDKGRKFDDLDLICRSGEKVEQFIEYAAGGTNANGKDRPRKESTGERRVRETAESIARDLAEAERLEELDRRVPDSARTALTRRE